MCGAINAVQSTASLFLSLQRLSLKSAHHRRPSHQLVFSQTESHKSQSLRVTVSSQRSSTRQQLAASVRLCTGLFSGYDGGLLSMLADGRVA